MLSRLRAFGSMFRVDVIDAGLVGNVTALHAQIHQDDSDNQAGKVFAGKAQEKEGEQG